MIEKKTNTGRAHTHTHIYIDIDIDPFRIPRISATRSLKPTWLLGSTNGDWERLRGVAWSAWPGAGEAGMGCAARCAAVGTCCSD